MTRVTKDPEQRRNEILDAAEELFMTKGFEQTAVSDIVKKVGVAQGLFYYYFKSKEEVLNAIMERYMMVIVNEAERLIGEEGLDAPAKLCRLFLQIFSFGADKQDLAEIVHEEKNMAMHYTIARKVLQALVPPIVKVVEQGIAEGVFDTPYPKDTVEILTTGLGEYLHDDFFTRDKEKKSRKFRAALFVAERSLAAKPGTLSPEKLGFI